MSLIPRDSLSDFYRLFDHAFPSIRSMSNAGYFSPKVDVIEKDTAFEIIADLPGVEKRNISVTCRDSTLTIEASTIQSEEDTIQDKVIHKERFEGKIMRSFTLSDNIDPQDIYAEFEDGVLVVVVPKLEAAKPGEAHHVEIS